MRSFAVACVVMVAIGCTQAPDLATEEAAIRKVDTEMVSALNAGKVDAWLELVQTDARMLPPGAPPVVGKDALRSLVQGFLSPEFAVKHSIDGVKVAQSADLAYIWYSYELTYKGPAGAPVTEKGKDVSIFTKSQDGNWKLAVDMWSENEPPAPPVPAKK